MQELINSAFSGVNLVYTSLLVAMMGYWVIVLLGVIDLDAFGLDIDTDFEAGDVGSGDFDADASADSAGGAAGWLGFFNVGEVPIMIYISIVLISMWIISMQINHYLDLHAGGTIAANRGLIAAALAIPNLVFSAFVAKIVLEPVRRSRLKKRIRTKLDGKTCVVTSLEVTEEFGRCEMSKREGSLILNARTRQGEVLRKGDAAEIVEEVVDGDTEYFIVTKKIWNAGSG